MNYYRRKNSYRLKNYDYTSQGYYFITIGVKNQEPYLGKIKNSIVGLSEIGCIAYQYWEQIPIHFSEIRVDEFIIMPNHMHGILYLKSDFQRSPIGIIVNQYKSSVKRWCNKNDHSYFQWHRNYYDNIIRDEIALYYIRRYIKRNPARWLKA